MRSDPDRLADMLDTITRHTSPGRHVLDDEVTGAAVMRWMEILGEAAGQVTEELRTSHPEELRPTHPVQCGSRSTGLANGMVGARKVMGNFITGNRWVRISGGYAGTAGE